MDCVFVAKTLFEPNAHSYILKAGVAEVQTPQKLFAKFSFRNLHTFSAEGITVLFFTSKLFL